MPNPINKLILLFAFMSPLAFAEPSHFSIKVGSAIVCHDQVSAEYFNDYMKTYFGKPAFTAGGANWWKVDGKLFDADVQYVFVGAGQDFIGATFRDSPDKLVVKMRDYWGIVYRLMAAGMWVAPGAGVIIKYSDKTTPSKMYCIGAPH